MAIDLRVGEVPAGDGMLRYHVVQERLEGHIVWAQELNQHLDLSMTDPAIAEMIERLGRYGLTSIVMQPRGTGISDPSSRPPTIEEQADDILAVMDAEGVERATLVGTGGHGPAVALVAARRPERVRALVLVGSAAIGPLVDDTACGWTPAAAADCVTRSERAFAHWGTGLTLDVWDAKLVAPHNLRLIGMMERCSASAEYGAAWYRRNLAFDGREVYAQVRVPARVLSVPDSAYPAATAAALAALIPGAEHRELRASAPGDHVGTAWLPISEQIGEMALGSERAAAAVDRALTTVLFVDIVGSTDHLARVGDAAWAQILDAHQLDGAREAAREGGRVVNVTGDGMLLELPGPVGAVRCARALQASVTRYGVALRAGVHSGECHRRGAELAGIAVHVGARIGALAGPGEVLLSEAAAELAAGADLAFLPHGRHELKGVPGTWTVLAVEEQDGVTRTAAPEPRLLDRAAMTAARRAPTAVRALNGVVNGIQRRRRPHALGGARGH